MKFFYKTLCVLLVLIGSWANAHALGLEPRAYSNIPIGMNFLIAGYGYTEGSVLSDPSVPIEDADLQVHGMVLGYARALDFWGQSGKVDVIVPYACVDGEGVFMGAARQRDVCGFGDPSFRVSINFYGAPSLSLKEYPKFQQNVIIGASLQIVAPLGQYDKDMLLNLGTNRWTLRPEIGLSKAWGSWVTELNAGAYFYTDNDDFFGGHHREQDPIYVTQAHLIYKFRRGIWAALDGNYYWGGQTTVDGVKSDDRQSNTRFGATLAFPVSKHNSIKLFGSAGVSTRFGGDFDLFGAAWQYRWGGGL